MLDWEADGPVSLQIASRPDFSDARPVYEGAAKSYFLSGLANGEYYLRLKGADGAVSAPVQLSVVHQSLSHALLLVVIGAIITLAITITILRGAHDD